jgi:hypothetical protein
MHEEQRSPPYGLSGLFAVLGSECNARDSIAFIPCSKEPQLEQCALLGLRAL